HHSTAKKTYQKHNPSPTPKLRARVAPPAKNKNFFRDFPHKLPLSVAPTPEFHVASRNTGGNTEAHSAPNGRVTSAQSAQEKGEKLCASATAKRSHRTHPWSGHPAHAPASLFISGSCSSPTNRSQFPPFEFGASSFNRISSFEFRISCNQTKPRAILALGLRH